MDKYKYKIHGLKVLSEIELDAYPLDFTVPDVVVSICDEVYLTDEIVYKGKYHIMTDKAVSEYVTGIGTFLIKDGSRINIKPLNNDRRQYVDLYVEGRGLAPALNQREMLTFHGSAIGYENSGTIILGESGAGKSSLAIGMIHSGFKFLSDDLINVESINNNIVVHQGLYSQKLSDKLISKFRLEDYVLRLVLYPGVKHKKYFVDHRDVLVSEPMRLKNIVIIERHDFPFEISRITGSEKLRLLFNHFYRKEFIDYFVPFEKQYEIINNMVKDCNVVLIRRENGVDSIDQQVKALNEVLDEY